MTEKDHQQMLEYMGATPDLFSASELFTYFPSVNILGYREAGMQQSVRDQTDKEMLSYLLDEPWTINRIQLSEEDWQEINQSLKNGSNQELWFAEQAQITNDLLKLAQDADKDTK